METLDKALAEWRSKKRRMGCVAAVAWWLRRFPHWKEVRRRFYCPGGTDKNGKFWEHVILTDGMIELDPAPWANQPAKPAGA